MRKRGFTLIELLVVIGIIAILGAILFPVFLRAKERGRQARCISNIRQIMMTLQMYVMDYEAYPGHAYATPDGGHFLWFQALEPYHGEPDLFMCPNVSEWEVGRNLAYGYNYQYLGNARSYNAGGNMPVDESQIRTPSLTLAVCDSDGTGTGAYRPSPSTDVDRLGNAGYVVDPPELPSRPGNRPAAGSEWSVPSLRHNDGTNIAFCDGHVKWYRREEIYQNNSAWNGRGTPDP
jgi:prepilin-type N-terminal cleavage/methylation domain-containing protein/prepilin-type processing-associated H-X9-DG protein